MTRPSIERLALVGAIDGPTPEEAVALFAIARKTPEEGRLIDALLTQHAHQPLPEPLLVAVAAALVERADASTAERALASATSQAALLLRADLLATGGKLEEAAHLVERILARDIDCPGARERHARWARPKERPSASASSRPTAPSDNPTSGPVEAPYRCVRAVARGGAGTVYEAIDDALGRRIGLKVYHKPDRARAQLLHEARVAVALAGEGIVRVFDVDPAHGWLAMEWAALGTLGSHLERVAQALDRKVVAPTGALSVRITRSLWTLARTIGRVHAGGWVHNDIKPANVLFVAEERVVLADFGAARRRGEPSPPGSRGYVSPERSSGRASDPRDDVHAFGRVLEGVFAQPARRAERAARESGAPEDGERALGAADEGDFWLRVATTCTGEDRLRPADGVELVRRIEALRPAFHDLPSVSRRTDKGG